MSTRGERALTMLLRLLPRPRRELGEALLAEAPFVAPRRRRLAWLAGGAWFVAREGLAASAYVIVLLGTAVALVLLDRAASSDDSGPFTLLVLLTASAMLGFAAPRRAWLPGLILGAVVALANLAYVTVGPARQHPIEPRGVGGAATLLVLVVPATLAAYAGAATGRRWRRSRP